MVPHLKAEDGTSLSRNVQAMSYGLRDIGLVMT